MTTRVSLELSGDKSTLFQVMACCHQATSHDLSQCWPRSMSPYGITGPQWVNSAWHVGKYGPVTMIAPASGHQVHCIPWVQMGTFNRDQLFMWIKILCIGYILWRIPTIESTFDVADMMKTATVKDVPIDNDALLNIQAVKFMFGKMASAPLLVVPLISARVPLISTRVSAHCQAILLAGSRTHFTNNFSLKTQIWRKFHFAGILYQMHMSRQRSCCVMCKIL